MTGSPEATSADERLRALELRLGRVRLLGWAGLLVAVAAFGWGLWERQAGAPAVGRLWLAEDPAGRLRAMFGVSADGVGLTMYDSTGQMRLDLGVTQGGVPGLMMLSSRGEPVVSINLIQGRIPTIRLTNMAESTRVQLVPRADGQVLDVRSPRPPDTLVARRPR